MTKKKEIFSAWIFEDKSATAPDRAALVAQAIGNEHVTNVAVIWRAPDAPAAVASTSKRELFEMIAPYGWPRATGDEIIAARDGKLSPQVLAAFTALNDEGDRKIFWAEGYLCGGRLLVASTAVRADGSIPAAADMAGCEAHWCDLEGEPAK